MFSFPLYNTLESRIDQKTEPIEPVKSSEFIKGIQSLDQDGLNKIYALIRYYDQLYNTERVEIPFKGKITEGELTFDLENIPNKLQIILFEFISLHLEHMKRIKKLEKEKKSIEKKTKE
jgi:hypothetical protein